MDNEKELYRQETFSKLSFLTGIIGFFLMILVPLAGPMLGVGLSGVGIFASGKVKNYLYLAMNGLICFTSLLLLYL